MLDKKEKEKIRRSDYDTLLTRKQYLETVITILEEMGAHTYKGHNYYDTKKELDYVLDVLAFDFTPKRNV